MFLLAGAGVACAPAGDASGAEGDEGEGEEAAADADEFCDGDVCFAACENDADCDATSTCAPATFVDACDGNPPNACQPRTARGDVCATGFDGDCAFFRACAPGSRCVQSEGADTDEEEDDVSRCVD